MANIYFEGEPNPVGRVVDGFSIKNEEVDGSQKRVGAEVIISVPPLGKFIVRIVTRDQFANESVEGAQLTSQQLEAILSGSCERKNRPPYVLNDRELSDEVLEKKIRGRVVAEDFALTLWFLDPTTA